MTRTVKFGLGAWAVAAIALIVGTKAGWVELPTAERPLPPPPLERQLYETLDSDPARLVLSKAERRQFGDAIREAGYNCPEFKLAIARGANAYGQVTEAWCGRPNLHELTNLKFKVTTRPNGRAVIHPW